MMDEIFDRQFQAGRADLNAGIDRGLERFGRSLMSGFEALNRIQFAAPWTTSRSAKKRGPGLA